mgnify:CR=1 FL=1
MTNWEEKNNILSKTFTFDSFLSAIKRIYECAPLIDDHNHHPTRTNTYNKVSVELTTHDKWKIITDKDYTIAKILDQKYTDLQ